MLASRYTYGTFKRLIAPIIQGGHLTQDPDTLRQTARTTLAHILSCKTGYHTSGIPAQIAGNAIGADTHLPSMGSEDFLKCLSRPALEKAGSDLGVLPRERVKDTRASVLSQIGETPYIHPYARFALTDEQIAKISETTGIENDEDVDPDDDGLDPGMNEDMPDQGHDPGEADDPSDDDGCQSEAA